MAWYGWIGIGFFAFFLIGAVFWVVFFFRVIFVRMRKLDRRFDSEKMQRVHFGRHADAALPLLRKMRAASCSEVSVQSQDGLALFGRFYPVTDPKGVFLLVHGYRSCGFYDFCGIFSFLQQEGYAVLLIDQRSHGKSEGRYIGYGALERDDCLRWIKWISLRYPSLPVFLYGVSMGCATVLMASGLLLPETVHGIVADCGYTKPDAIFRKVAEENLRIPRVFHRPLLFFTNHLCRLFAGYSPEAFSTVDALKTNRLPVLFIHGKADRFVPCRMTEENYRSCMAEKELFLSEKAGHAMCMFAEAEHYRSRLKAFAERYGGSKKRGLRSS